MKIINYFKKLLETLQKIQTNTKDIEEHLKKFNKAYHIK